MQQRGERDGAWGVVEVAEDRDVDDPVVEKPPVDVGDPLRLPGPAGVVVGLGAIALGLEMVDQDDEAVTAGAADLVLGAVTAEDDAW